MEENIKELENKEILKKLADYYLERYFQAFKELA